MDFTLQDARRQQRLRCRPFRVWRQPEGNAWMQFYRTDAGYLLRFPGLADFQIAGHEFAVTCRPAPGVQEETSKHLFLNQVLPLVLSKRGKLVFHASAVEVKTVAAAFVADSGRGKSTLAASFASAGFRFLCDDGLVLEEQGNDYQAMPSHPSIRLWQDSQDALVGAGVQSALPVQYTTKARILSGDGVAFCAQPRALKRVYFLGDGSAHEPTVQRLSAVQTLGEWVKHAFLLDPDEKTLLSAHFDRLVSLANQLPGYHLDYPRRYDVLAAVRRVIIANILDTNTAL